MPTIKIAAGRCSRELAARIAQICGQKLVDVEIMQFSDGEFQPSFSETLRGCEVFIVQSTFPPAENLMELLYMIDAAKKEYEQTMQTAKKKNGWKGRKNL